MHLLFRSDLDSIVGVLFAFPLISDNLLER